MSRYERCLNAGIEEEERRAAHELSLREKFEKKEENVVYVESTAERVIQAFMGLLSIILSMIGVAVLIIPETRTLLIEILVRFVEEATGLGGF